VRGHVIPVTMAGRLMAVPAAYEQVLAAVCWCMEVVTSSSRGSTRRRQQRKALYSLVGDEMIILSGMYEACERQARSLGYTLQIVEDTEPPRGGDVFQPDFHHLGEVSWRPRQFDVFAMVAHERCGIIRAVTAFGKSFTLRKIARGYPNARFLFIVPGVQLMESFHRALEDEVGRGKVGRLGGTRERTDRRYRLTVSTPQSAYKVEESWPDVVFWDEVHQAPTETGLEVLERFNRAKMFGFTGTLKRTDGGNKKAESFFGPVRVDYGYRQAVADGVITPVILRQVAVRIGCSSDDWATDIARARHCIWRNQYRNGVLVNQFVEFAQQDPEAQALFSVDKLEHALFVQHLMHEKGFRVPILCGKVDPRRRNRLKADGIWIDEINWVIDHPGAVFKFQQEFMRGEQQYAIGTSMFGTGLDFVHLGFIVYASSIQSSIQFLQTGGRGMRLSENKRRTVVVDTRDFFDHRAEARSVARFKEAESEGWEAELVSP